MIHSTAAVAQSANDELTDAHLDAISGGSYIGDLARLIARAFQRHGDERRPTSQP